MSVPPTYRVERVRFSVVKDFILQHHYAHGCHNGPITYALWDGEELVGACAFSTPCSENVRASVFGAEHVDRVTELSRLVLLDRCPRNSESWFVSRCLRALKAEKPGLWAVLSYADSGQGHEGIVYRALNFYLCGTTTPSRRFWVDGDGRLRHPRQCGHNLTADEARARGWVAVRQGFKYRYVYLLADSKRHRRELEAMLLLEKTGWG